MPLPDSVLGLLVDAVAALDRGQAVTVEPRRTVLTTQGGRGTVGIRGRRVGLLEGEDAVHVARPASAGGVGGRARIPAA